MKEQRDPLDKLLKKDVKFIWQKEQEQAIQQLWKMLMPDLVLNFDGRIQECYSSTLRQKLHKYLYGRLFDPCQSSD